MKRRVSYIDLVDRYGWHSTSGEKMSYPNAKSSATQQRFSERNKTREQLKGAFLSGSLKESEVIKGLVEAGFGRVRASEMAAQWREG